MKPVLLLIPGMLNDERVWAPVVDALAGQADARVADVCHGASIDDMARAAWALVDDVAPERRLVLAGFSLGGYVALQMLASRPARRVDALVLIGASARAETPEGAAVREKTIAATQRDFARVVDGLISYGTHGSFRANVQALQAMRSMMLETGSDVAVRQHRAVMARADQRGTARGLRLPCAVLVGEADRITPPELSVELAALIPGARLERLPRCGHLAPLEQSQRVAAALRTFVNQET